MGVLVGIPAPLALLHQFDDIILQLIILYLCLLSSLVQQALGIGIILEMLTLGRVVLNESVGHTHGEVGIAVMRSLLIHLKQSLSQHTLVVFDDIIIIALSPIKLL